MACNKQMGFSFLVFDAKFAVQCELRSRDQSVDSMWHHLAGTFDGTVLSFFVDSLLVARVDYDEVRVSHSFKRQNNQYHTHLPFRLSTEPDNLRLNMAPVASISPLALCFLFTL